MRPGQSAPALRTETAFQRATDEPDDHVTARFLDTVNLCKGHLLAARPAGPGRSVWMVAIEWN